MWKEFSSSKTELMPARAENRGKVFEYAVFVVCELGCKTDTDRESVAVDIYTKGKEQNKPPHCREAPLVRPCGS